MRQSHTRLAESKFTIFYLSFIKDYWLQACFLYYLRITQHSFQIWIFVFDYRVDWKKKIRWNFYLKKDHKSIESTNFVVEKSKFIFSPAFFKANNAAPRRMFRLDCRKRLFSLGFFFLEGFFQSLNFWKLWF